MRYDKATDDQLKTIIKHDHFVPTELLVGLVDEMLNRQLLKGLLLKVIKKRFLTKDIACNVLHTTIDDLLQDLSIELLTAVHKYKPGKDTFFNFAFLCLYRKLKDWEKLFEFGKKKTLNESSSLELYNDLRTNERSVEKAVMKKLMFEEKMNELNEGEKETFLLYLKGYSYKEIAEMLSISKAGICRRMEKATLKLCGKRIGEFNMQNYKVGA